jgi:hypothetical protein
MSKAQLMAFLAKAETNPAIQQRIDAAADASASAATKASSSPRPASAGISAAEQHGHMPVMQ